MHIYRINQDGDQDIIVSYSSGLLSFEAESPLESFLLKSMHFLVIILDFYSLESRK